MGAEMMASTLGWVEGAVERDHPRRQLIALGVSWNHRNSIFDTDAVAILARLQAIQNSHLLSKPKITVPCAEFASMDKQRELLPLDTVTVATAEQV